MRLVIQGLRICLVMQGTQVQFLIRKLRFHMLQSNLTQALQETLVQLLGQENLLEKG